MGLKQQLDDLDIPSIIKEEEGHLGKLSLQFVFQSCISFRENIDKFYSNLFQSLVKSGINQLQFLRQASK